MVNLQATYRVQMHAGFNLRQATALIPSWQKLGISHLYSSPWLRARHGSTHGYDLIDPTELNPDLGTEADRTAFIRALNDAGMGLLLDFVPNHMAASAENWRWDDVLTHGPSSRYARWFDIDWRSPDPELRGRVLLPVLGDSRHKVLERGEVQLKASPQAIRLTYYDHSFPLDPPSLGRVLRFTSDRVSLPPAEARGEFAEFLAIVHLLRTIPPRNTPRPELREQRRLKWSEAQTRLHRLLTDSEAIGEHVENILRAYADGEKGRERMASLLDRQVYRLVFWRRAAREINYRRFFDINDLIGVRIGDPEVFEEFHALIFAWIAVGEVAALRIDHIDGLQDPKAYLERLRHRLQQLSPQRHVPVYVEKILACNESIPKDWPIAGTTGYEFLGAAESLFIDPQGAEKIEGGYRKITRETRTFAQVGRSAKQRILRIDLSAYTARLGRALSDISSAEGVGSVISPQDAMEALVGVIAALPLYRTYVDERSQAPSIRDRHVLEQTIEKARAASAGHHSAQGPSASPAQPGKGPPVISGPSVRQPRDALDLLADVLLMRGHAERNAADQTRRMRFIQRFQQLCVAAAAKGIEDTSFYLHVPLVSRNEVGAEPDDVLRDAVQRFHIANATRAANFPESLLAVTTHDTKRGADVRARLDVLSEMPEQWLARVGRWRQLNKSLRRKIGGKFAPDANTEYLFYQTLVGTWPCRAPSESGGAPPEIRLRIEEYMLKAAREAKRHTSWVDPQEGFEAALMEFVQQALPEQESEFTREVDGFVRLMAPHGALNSLSRTLIQFTAPGVPDLYQGDEFLNFVLVDPDNRRPVDWTARRKALTAVEQVTALDDWAPTYPAGTALQEKIDSDQWPDERIKLFVIHRALQLRAARADVFHSQTYRPLEVIGPRAAHVFAFARWSAEWLIVTLTGRLIMSLERSAGSPEAGVWSGTRVLLPLPLRAERFRCHLNTRESQPSGTGALVGIDVEAVFGSVPLALLVGRRTQPT